MSLPPPLEGFGEPRERRPFVWANCAISLDGKLALSGGRRARLSSEEDLARVQSIRARSDAILVGAGTVLLDDPSLRVHEELLAPEDRRDLSSPDRRVPARIVLDSRGRLPAQARVLDGRLPTIILTTEECRREYPPFVKVGRFGHGLVDLRSSLAWLYEEMKVRRLLVEGGARVFRSFLESSLVDRFTVYVAPILIGEEGAPSLLGGPAPKALEEGFPLTLERVDLAGPGLVLTLRPSVRPS